MRSSATIAATLRLSAAFAAFILFGVLPVASAAIHSVGPGQPLAHVNDVPWESLGAGDEVNIHWRKEPYRAKWVLCRRGTTDAPIIIRGIPGPDGQPPRIDGRDAETRKDLNFWHEARGIIKVGGANRPKDLLPAHIVIEGLEISGARPPYSFTGRQGRLPYARNAAGIFLSKGEHITIRGCILRDCGNGLLVSAESSDVLIEKCWIHNNGIEGSVYEHNAYTAAAGITFQYNRFGPLRPGCRGNNLKDRSAGTVIRYNWIEGGNRELDLVDAEDSERLRKDPRYSETFVYGNTLIEPDGTDNNQIVHYGGDSGKKEWYRPGILRFHHNTVISRRSGATTLFKLSSGRERVDCRNNLIYTTSPGRSLSILATDGTVFLNNNWIKEGWTLQRGKRPTRDLGENQSGGDPQFLDLARNDFRLRPTSAAAHRVAKLPPAVTGSHPLSHLYIPHRNGRIRTPSERSNPSIGALETAD